MEHGLTKVEVIGDAYYVVGGCPDVLPAQEHAVNTVDAALAMLRMLPRVIVDPTVQMRVGVHSGPVVAAIVGKRDPRYHLFGATVSYAEKMESHGIPGRVHCRCVRFSCARLVLPSSLPSLRSVSLLSNLESKQKNSEQTKEMRSRILLFAPLPSLRSVSLLSSPLSPPSVLFRLLLSRLHTPRNPRASPRYPFRYSEATYELLKDIPRFRAECRGGIDIEGEEGKKMTYLVSAPPKRLANSRAKQLGNILLG
jgi:hypothetical protein